MHTSAKFEGPLGYEEAVQKQIGVLRQPRNVSASGAAQFTVGIRVVVVRVGRRATVMQGGFLSHTFCWCALTPFSLVEKEEAE